jgi:hypothetical protein
VGFFAIVLAAANDEHLYRTEAKRVDKKLSDHINYCCASKDNCGFPMKKIRRLLLGVSTVISYSKAENLQNLGEYEASLAMLEKIDEFPEYVLRVILLKAVNYHKLKCFALAVEHYEAFQVSKYLGELGQADQDYLCAYARFYGSSAKRHLDHHVNLQGSISELQRLAEKASFTVKREFKV